MEDPIGRGVWRKDTGSRAAHRVRKVGHKGVERTWWKDTGKKNRIWKEEQGDRMNRVVLSCPSYLFCLYMLREGCLPISSISM